MRIKTMGLLVAGAAVVAGAAGGVAWAASDREPSVRIVEYEQPTPPEDCPVKNGQPVEGL